MARKLRLLCLHGMYQNAESFAAKTKHLRADDVAEFVYLNGPFSVTPRVLAKPSSHSHSNMQQEQALLKKTSGRQREELFRAWWRPSGPQQAEPTQLARDRDALLAYLRVQLAELGEVDGVLGFSQGASLASWLCSAQARLELRWSPRVAVLIGSYAGPQQYSLDSGILASTNSLHMFGLNDHVVSAAKSRAVVDIFRDSQDSASQVLTAVHSQGHVIPKCGDALAQLHSFLAQNAALPLSASANASASTPLPMAGNAESVMTPIPSRP
ncbi:hypothetical protein PybrP1_004735 [[Pythium] brassicae (nom. inval.)]|nr:hypothetical protein PybrP1_004735 [[Pythium] brassicae (nom. inval.)]